MQWLTNWTAISVSSSGMTERKRRKELRRWNANSLSVHVGGVFPILSLRPPYRSFPLGFRPMGPSREPWTPLPKPHLPLMHCAVTYSQSARRLYRACDDPRIALDERSFLRRYHHGRCYPHENGRLTDSRKERARGPVTALIGW